MAKYTVRVYEVHAIDIDIDEASSNDDAKAQANLILEAGHYPNGKEVGEPEYNHSLETLAWKVTEENPTT